MNEFKRLLRYVEETVPANLFTDWQLGMIHGASNIHDPKAWDWLDKIVEKHDDEQDKLKKRA